MNTDLRRFFRSFDDKALAELAESRDHRSVSGKTWKLKLLYLNPPFQIELATVDPNYVVPRHRHPFVDSVEVALWGDSEYTVNRHTFHTRYDVPLHLRATPIARTAWHGGMTSTGGSFLSIQFWHRKPVPIIEDWEGEPLA